MAYPNNTGPGVTPMVQGNVQIVALERMVQNLQERVSRLESSGSSRGSSKSSAPRSEGGTHFTEFQGGHVVPRVAPKSDLLEEDGTIKKFADVVIYKDPPRWKGKPYVSCTYSQCEPEYLDQVAGFELWKAGKQHESKEMDEKGRPRWLWSLRNASKAAGWAALMRAAEAGPPQPTVEAVPEDDIPS